jgi:hypothetical protein
LSNYQKIKKMKKQLLSILSVLFATVLVHAQDITTYRGAFAPAPETQWTDGWTNWDPQNTAYGAATVTVSGSITTNTTWTSNNVYKISGIVYVNDGVTLTIQPGTVIRGDETVANSSLFITRGAKIQAIGTACNPIVFTSNKAAGARAKADWGGVVILGKGLNNLGTNNQIEGTAAGEPRNFHGGLDNSDNSGVLKYVRIEYGGFVFAANSEINGLTLGSVGSGTTIDYVQCSFINDDAFEWFGGAVNCKHLVAYRCLDDDFDSDNGYIGTVQYGLAIKDPALADDPAISTSEGFETDNNAGGTTATPKTAGKFYNITQIGAFRCNTNAGVPSQPSANGFRRGVRLRRNTELKIFNSIFMNNWRGLVIDAVTNTTAQAAFQNNIIAGDFATSWVAPYAGVSLYGEDATSTTFLNTTGFNNTQISTNACDLLENVWGGTAPTFPLNPDFRPKATGANFTTLTTGAAAGPDLFPVVEIDGALFTANQSTDFLVDVIENGTGSSNGTITITIPKPSGWNIGVEGLTLVLNVSQSGVSNTSNVNGGTLNSNGNWNFLDNGNNIIATSKPGVIVALADFTQLGFTATRKGTTATGTNQSLGINITGGGDNTVANNSAVVGFSAN